MQAETKFWWLFACAFAPAGKWQKPYEKVKL
jgi:hypothetical protein